MREIPNSVCDFVAETGAMFCENWIKISFVTKIRKFKHEFTFLQKSIFFKKIDSQIFEKNWHFQQIDVTLSPFKSSSI